jgi:hypothetical protein
VKKIASLLFLSLCFSLPPAAARDVQLQSLAIEKQTLKTSVTAIDVAGRRRAFNEVFIVRIKGRIPVYDALPVQLLIGDEPVREYGASGDGIYFKVYDPEWLKRWQGKPIRYVVPPGKAIDSGLLFPSEPPQR